MAGILATAATIFTATVGINTHADMIGSSYQNFAQMENALKYLGITNVRDTYDNPNDPAEFAAMAQSIGAKFDFYTALGNVPVDWQIAQIQANPSIVAYAEGYNESDCWWQTYGSTTGIAATQAVQEALYNAVKSSPQLINVGVIQSSFCQLNTFSAYGDMSAYADFANTHTYFGTGNNPGGSQDLWTQYLVGLAQLATPGKPTITTETGYFTMQGSVNGVDPIVQAKYELNLILEQAQAGISKSYIYDLVDHFEDAGNTNSEYHFGVFNADWTPKPAANAIHALTTLLADSNSGSFTPGKLDYTLAGLPAGASSSLFQKSDGTFVLAIWNDQRLSGPTTQSAIVVAPTTTSLTFGRAYGSVMIYDPMVGTFPIGAYANVDSVSLSVTDHPILVTISAKKTGAITQPAIASSDIISTPNVAVQVQGLAVADTSTSTLTVVAEAQHGVLAAQDNNGHVLKRNQHRIIFSGPISVVNAELSTLIYTADATTGPDALVVRATDASGHSAQQRMSVTVIAPPPVIVPGGPVLTAPASFSLSKGSKAGIANVTLYDAQAAQNASQITATATSQHGKLSLNSFGASVQGLQTSAVTLSGSFAQVSAALATLSLTENVKGSDTVTITVTDQAGMLTTQEIPVIVLS